MAQHGEEFTYPEEAYHLEKAAAHRKDEYIAGRRCARSALNRSGIQAGALPMDKDGLPQWPSGSVGSISHSKRLCCAVAGPVHSARCLGLDVEMTHRLKPAAMKRIMHGAEFAFAEGDQVRASLLFSAKEAFFKAQFPVWRAYPNFRDLALAVDWERGSASVLELAPHLPAPLLHAARHMRFRFAFFDDYVVSLCWCP